MKKNTILITGILLLGLWAPGSSMAAGKILEECKLTPFQKVENLNLGSDLEFRMAIETAGNQYHNYINCIFNKASEKVLSSSGSSLADLLNPQKACLSDKAPTKMREKLLDSSPNNLLPATLKAYQQYAEHLQALQAKRVSSDSTSGNPGFAATVQNQQILQLLVQNEIQNAIVALDTAFIALKELRSAYVIHQHLQCILKNLGLYQTALANMRSVIEILPPLFHNASTS